MDNLLKNLNHTLPALVTRKELERLTGGLLKARTLANLDCAGKGPAKRIRYGRKVAYERGVLLDWLVQRLEVQNV